MRELPSIVIAIFDYKQTRRNELARLISLQEFEPLLFEEIYLSDEADAVLEDMESQDPIKISDLHAVLLHYGDGERRGNPRSQELLPALLNEHSRRRANKQKGLLIICYSGLTTPTLQITDDGSDHRKVWDSEFHYAVSLSDVDIQDENYSFVERAVSAFVKGEKIYGEQARVDTDIERNDVALGQVRNKLLEGAVSLINAELNALSNQQLNQNQIAEFNTLKAKVESLLAQK